MVILDASASWEYREMAFEIVERLEAGGLEKYLVGESLIVPGRLFGRNDFQDEWRFELSCRRPCGSRFCGARS